ncbi:MAG: DNA-directed RNA polymerase subunit H [Candidatus Odinarchaeota archaeon]
MSEEEEKLDSILEGVKSILITREYEVIDTKILEDGSYDIIGKKAGEEGEKDLKIIARIPPDDPVGVGALRDFKKVLEEEKYNQALLIARGKYTHYTKREAEKAGIETFSLKFPFFDLFSHELVPKHEVAPAEEVDDVIRKYSVSVKQLPKISSLDPAVQLLGAKAGDIIKITRNSPTAGKFIAYRYVIE